MKLRLLSPALLFLTTWSVFGQNYDERLKKIEAAIDQEIASHKSARDNADEQGLNRAMAQREMLGRLRAALMRANAGELSELLNQIATYSNSPEVKKEIDDLIAAIRQEREEKEQVTLKQIGAAQAKAREAVRSARKAADLDAVIAELGALRDQRYDESGRSPTVQAAINRVQPTLQFVTRWQDYLASSQAGDLANARTTLENLAREGDTALGILPRSEILARMRNLTNENEEDQTMSVEERTDEIMAKTKTLEDVSGALKELHKLQSKTGRTNFDQPPVSTIRALNSIEKSYREFCAGLPTALDVMSATGESMAHPATISLRVQLILLVLPRYLGLPPDLHPNDHEAVQPFLERCAAAAKERGDMMLADRVNAAQRVLLRGVGPTVNDSSALTAFTGAQNQEAAGQFALAVTSYQTALKIGTTAVPAKLIGERLAQIKAEYPAEFEKGMERFLNPPPASYSYSPNDPRYYSLPASMRARMEMPTATPQPTPPVLVVPGATPVEAPKKSATPSPSATPASKSASSATPQATAVPQASP